MERIEAYYNAKIHSAQLRGNVCSVDFSSLSSVPIFVPYPHIRSHMTSFTVTVTSTIPVLFSAYAINGCIQM
ncbi:hypothetical protein RB195_017987 [Necator americanus]|uniref:Uncharacterized protein n=1 Tax=Necator americanus TaxID=51031 RepID=A0ABR1CA24_NECAM